MGNEKKLFKDTIIYAIGNLGTKLLSFFMLPIYTSYYTTNEYGEWDVISATISMIIPFITFELVSATYRWLLEEKEFKKKKVIIRTGLISLLRNTMIFNLVAILFSLFVDYKYMHLSILLVDANIILSFMQQSIRGLNNNKLFVFSGIINTLINFIVNIFLMFVLNMRIEAFFYSSIISAISVSIVLWILGGFTKYLYNSKYSKALYKKFIKYSFPLVPGAISWWVMNTSDRFIIKVILGNHFNGIYAISNKIPALLTMLSSIFFMAWKDNVISNDENKDQSHYYSKIFKSYFNFMTSGVIVLIAFSQILINILAKGEFEDAWKYSNILLVATLFNVFSQFWGTAYHKSKQTKNIFITSIIGAIANILINIIFIGYLGLYAASISTAVSFFLMWILRVYDKKKDFNIDIPRKDILYLGSIMVVFFILSYNENYMINIFLAIMSLAFFVWYNFKGVKNILKKYIFSK